VVDGNLPEQQVMQSAKLSEGQLLTQDSRSAPSSPPVHDDSSEHLSLHSVTQMENTAPSVGQSLMQASREPPGHPLGEGDGDGDGTGVGAGLGVGSGAEYVPLVTQPPHPSSRSGPTALFNQHSLFACTQVYPTQPSVDEHWLQHSSALPVLMALDCRLVPSLFLPTDVWHVPGVGEGVGDGDGEGSAHVGGGGPNLIPRGA